VRDVDASRANLNVPALFEDAALEAARRPGDLLRRRFRDTSRLRIEAKGRRDFVTEVDREAEDLVVGFLRARFPDHRILAEESYSSSGDEIARDGATSRYRWIVDPLDGTTNFIHGVPTFAVSVALEDDSGLLAAAIHDPIHDETYHACRGGGSRLDGEPIECSRVTELDDALLATGFPFRDLSRADGYLRAFETFMRTTAGIRRAGAASLDLAFTASGRYDGFWEVGLHPWDLAAGALLIRESGGRVTDVVGGESYLESGEILAAGPSLHEAMLEVTRGAFGR
jgi:myo-inositol-1(or 4)-monophosphatase